MKPQTFKNARNKAMGYYYETYTPEIYGVRELDAESLPDLVWAITDYMADPRTTLEHTAMQIDYIMFSQGKRLGVLTDVCYPFGRATT
jgi:hypothetical protein